MLWRSLRILRSKQTLDICFMVAKMLEPAAGIPRHIPRVGRAIPATMLHVGGGAKEHSKTPKKRFRSGQQGSDEAMIAFEDGDGMNVVDTDQNCGAGVAPILQLPAEGLHTPYDIADFGDLHAAM